MQIMTYVSRDYRLELYYCAVPYAYFAYEFRTQEVLLNEKVVRNESNRSPQKNF